MGGVASYTVTSTWSTATEQAQTTTYNNLETGGTGTSSPTYQTQTASMEQAEVQLQANKDVEVDKPVSSTFVLMKTTTPMDGSAPAASLQRCCG